MLAYYIDHLSPFVFQINGVGPRWYGVSYLLAFLLAFLLLRWFSRHGYSRLPEEKVADFIAATALFGVLLGGRLGYLLLYRPGDFLGRFFHDPLLFFRVWEGGMASHGGILGVALFTWWYARRHGISWMGLGDNLAVAAPLGLFLGRCANFINGELYGRAVSAKLLAQKAWWAVQFPGELFESDALAGRAVEAARRLDPALTDDLPFELDTPGAIIQAAQTSEPVRAMLAGILTPRHPSQLYEGALEGLALFAALWLIRTKTRAAEGVATGAFFVLYALARIACEQFREPDAGIAFTLGLTRGQFLSLFALLFGAGVMAFCGWRNKPAQRPA